MVTAVDWTSGLNRSSKAARSAFFLGFFLLLLCKLDTQLGTLKGNVGEGQEGTNASFLFGKLAFCFSVISVASEPAESERWPVTQAWLDPALGSRQ